MPCHCPLISPQVNGDSGNDIELFQVPGVNGCIVGNAHPELLSFAELHKGDPRMYLVGAWVTAWVTSLSLESSTSWQYQQ